MTEPFCHVLRWAFHSGAWQPSRAEWMLALRSVQPEEMLRIQSFAYKRDAKASMAGRLMLRAAARRLLARQRASLSNSQLKFERTSHGRPFLKAVIHHSDPSSNSTQFNLADLDMNVSHQGEWTVLVASDKGRYRVGVDVMKVERPSGVRNLADFFKSMRRQFSSSEWNFIDDKGVQEETRLRRFYRHWCIKESFVKCEGKGLSFSLDRLECKLAPQSSVPSVIRPEVVGIAEIFVDKAQPSSWYIEEHVLDESHVVAVAWWHQVNGLAPTLTTFDVVSFGDLVSESDAFNDAVKDNEWDQFNEREAFPKWMGLKSA